MYSTQDTDVDSDPEIKFLKQARHQRLVLFLGCGRMDSGDLFMVLEFCGAGDLTLFLFNGSDIPGWDMRVSLLLDVIHGLMYLHVVHAAVHRDLKSDNVLLNHESGQLRAKISDFGTSKRITDLGSGVGEEATGLIPGKQKDDYNSNHAAHSGGGRIQNPICKGLERTLTGGQGTLLWMAPEILEALNETTARYGQPADIYAFGMIMYEAVELRRPWFHLITKDSDPIITSVLAGKRPLFSALSYAHKEYTLLMKNCWHQVPSKRPTVREVGSAMQVVRNALFKDNNVSSGEPSATADLSSGAIELTMAGTQN